MRIRNDNARDNENSREQPVASDANEFRAAIGRVRRLPEVADIPRAPKPRAAATMRVADERAALAESQRADVAQFAEALGDAAAYRRAEVPEQTLRRLKRAEFAIEDELDLHGSNERAAENALRSFLAEARDAAHHCVRIVHGKGLHSAQGPVLKSVVERALSLRADVLAYASAPIALGGTGAVLVLLAKKRYSGKGRPNRSQSSNRDD